MVAHMETKAETSPARDVSGLTSQREIIARGGFSKSHLYNMLARGQFPEPALRCGPRFTRWSTASVDQWFADPAAWMGAHKPVATTAP